MLALLGTESKGTLFEEPLRLAFQRVQEERRDVDIDVLQETVSNLRRGLPCTCLDTDEFDNCGAYNLIFYLQFIDGVTWVARLPAISRAIRPLNDPIAQRTMMSTIHIMQFLDEESSIPVPRIYGFDTTCNNDLRRPYVIMDMVPGKPFWDLIDEGWELHAEAIHKIVQQWGAISIELASFEFDRIGSPYRAEENNPEVAELITPYNLSLNPRYDSTVNRGPFYSAIDYLLAQSGVKRCFDKPHLPSYGQHLRMSLVESFLGYFVDYRYINGPFVLSHPELDLQNIMVDIEKGEITGIIDWDFAAVLPLQSHLVLPRTLNAEFLPASEFEGFEEQYPFILEFSKKYRCVYEQSIKSAAERFGLDYSVDEILDRSLMYGLFEKAVSYMPNEKYLPALWNHVYGGGLEPQENTRNAMRKSDWATAMAVKWNVEVQTARNISTTEAERDRRPAKTAARHRRRSRFWRRKMSKVIGRWKSGRRAWFDWVRTRQVKLLQKIKNLRRKGRSVDKTELNVRANSKRNRHG